MMRIHNIRTGFAANSSSTHGMLHAPGMQDHLVEDGRFGWENFVAASPEAKARWLACHLIATAQETCGDEAAQAMALAWLGFTPSLENYVDHQSLVRLPKDWAGKGVDSRFFAEFRDFVLQEGIVVLGGHDNYDANEPPQLCGDIDYRSILPVDTSVEFVGRRDSHGWWVLFSRRDGTKLRVSFDHDIQKVDAEKSDVPELVDVKLTNYCTRGCDFCHQGSTLQGRHADVDDVWRLAEVLREMRVFEVALGGGEPAEHPKFIEILKTFRDAGVVPNFTTRKLDWLWDPSQRLQILPLIGGWAFSAELPGAVRDLAAELSVVPHNKRPHIQYIVGVQDQHGFETMVRVCVETRLRLVLLGPKTTGRGSAATWHKVDWIPTVMRAIRDGLDVGIDTVLAAAYQSELVAAGVPSWCYTTQEGKFSMYVDLVEHRMGPSSYAPEGVVSLPRFGCDWRAGITEQFQGW